MLTLSIKLWCVIIVAGMIAIILIAVAMLYNRLVKHRNNLREAWSGIEVQLKRRHDLVPGLVAVVKGYSDHEKSLLESVTQARSDAKHADHAAVKNTGQAENQLAQQLSKLMILAESYPQLRADQQFSELAKTLIEIEDQLQYARRYYNGSTRDMNNLVETFPGNLIAGVSGFTIAEFFEVENVSERLRTDLKQHLSQNES